MAQAFHMNTSAKVNEHQSPSPGSEYTVFEESSHPVSPAAMERSYAGTGPNWPGTNDSRQDQPRPGWYISRANGLFVPLIALDELPESIQLRDVPRYMVHWQTAGMECLGEFSAATQKYEMIHGDASSLQDQWQHRYATDAVPSELDTHRPASVISGVGSQYESAMSTHSTRASRINPSGLPCANRNDDDVQSRIDDIIQSNTQGPSTADHLTTSLTPRPLPPSGREPDLGRKVYCTYWVSSGECNYTQQGCLYKHEMPDRATLAKIGFRTVPRWWQERHSQGMEPLRKAGHGSEGLAKQKQKHHHHVHHQQQQHGRSGSEESRSSGGTDSTSSLRLGNPDSQRFRRSKLNAAVDAMGKSVRGRGDSNMASKRGSGSHAQQRGRFSKPETRARGRWPMDFNNGISSQLHSRRESTASVREMRVLNATDPPLQPLQQSSAAHRPIPAHLLRLQVSPRLSIASPTLLSPKPNDASVDSDIAITAPPSTPATLQDAQEDENEKVKGKDKSSGIYDPKTQQVVSPSVIHKPLFTNANANAESKEGECQITNLNRRMADAAVSRAGSMRVEQMSSGSTGASAKTAAAASQPLTATTSTTPSTPASASTGKPHKKAKQPTKTTPQIKAKTNAKAKGKAKAKAIIPNAKNHGLAQMSSSVGDGQHDDLLLVQQIPRGEGDPAGGHGGNSGAGGASSGRDSSRGAASTGVGSGSGSGSGSKPEQTQNGKGQSHRKAKAKGGDSNSNSNTNTKRKGGGNFRGTLVSE